MYFIEIVDGKAVASITTDDQANEDDDDDDDVDMESCDGVAPLPEDTPGQVAQLMICKDKQSDNNSLKQSNNNSVNNDTEIHVGKWFLVDYDGEYFPGEVLEEGEEDDFLFSVMQSAGNGCGQAQKTQHFI